jgi:hypothetical protein
MQLTYRGKHYQYNPTTPAMKSSPLLAKYRGVSYQLNQYAELINQPILELTYRGVTYSTNSYYFTEERASKPAFKPATAIN